MEPEEPQSAMPAIPILPERLDWPSVIGNLILNFSILDSLVIQFLRNHLPDEAFEKVRNWHFKDRVDHIGEILEKSGRSKEELAAFGRFVSDLDPVRALRNHVAHGHFLLRFDPNAQGFTLSVFQAKDLGSELMPNARHVAFDELRDGVTKLPVLIESMNQLISEFASCGSLDRILTNRNLPAR